MSPLSVIAIFIILNVLAYLIMHKDKHNARNGRKRISKICWKLKSKKKYYVKNPKNKQLDKKIRKYALYRDFLFLSDVFIPVNNEKAIIIDNIIFGNKYIYVISQKHWEGLLKGFEYDTKWMIT